jgi:dye decolorizing peroxidase
MPDDPKNQPGRGLTRRHLLLGGAAAAGAGAVGAVGLGLAAELATQPQPAAPELASAIVPFYGEHQAGIDTAPQSNAVFIALDLRPEVDAAALARLMRVLSSDAARMSAGEPALADTEPELAAIPRRLTVTFGFGPNLVARVGGTAPEWLAPLPAFTIDRLEDAFSGGDLLLQIAADDAVTVAHAARMLLKDARSFTTVRWSQRGFRRAAGSEAPGTTMRNLFGQVDGTANPKPGSPEFDETVWSNGTPAWMRGGTGFVLRRIAMDLEGWDRIDRTAREASLGRRMDTGAPLTGTLESDTPDLEATTSLGFPVIPAYAHVRRAKGTERIFRRGYNYDEPVGGAAGISDSGLLFASFQADVARQFVPIQRRLDELDLLNTWTKPIGSAVFAIPPGCAEGGYVGETLF